MDQGLKWLVHHHPADILALALPGAEFIEPLPGEITAPQLVMDTLLRVRYRGVECAVDIEAEARPEPDIGSRLFDYAARVRGETGLTVLSVVLWLQRHGKPPISPYKIAVADLVVGTWRFFGVEVYKLEADVLLQQGEVGLLPLIPFTHNGGDEAVLERAVFEIYERAPADQMRDLEAVLATFGSRIVGNAVMKTILGRLPVSTDLFTTSPLYQEIVGEAEQRGREEGREEGRLATTRESTLIILRQRFADVPADIVTALATADLATTRAVLTHALGDTLEQIRARLGLPSA